MENLIRRISVIFILCMIAIILIFLGINYQNKHDIKKNKVIEEKTKLKKEDLIKKEKTNNEEESIKEESNQNNNQSVENENTNYNEVSDNNTNNNVGTYTTTNNNDNNIIPVEKFNSKINNNRLYVGETANITTTIYPDNATIKDTTYASSNKNIAIVSKDGVVTAINPGICYITITVKNVGSGQIKVNVLSTNDTVYEETNDEE